MMHTVVIYSAHVGKCLHRKITPRMKLWME